MRALTYHGSNDDGRGDFRVEDVPDPSVGPGMVRLDVEWCGICGSDLHEFAAHTVSGYAPPIIIGHEFAGTVAEVGEGVEGQPLSIGVSDDGPAVADGVLKEGRLFSGSLYGQVLGIVDGCEHAVAVGMEFAPVRFDQALVGRFVTVTGGGEE